MAAKNAKQESETECNLQRDYIKNIAKHDECTTPQAVLSVINYNFTCLPQKPFMFQRAALQSFYGWRLRRVLEQTHAAAPL